MGTTRTAADFLRAFQQINQGQNQPQQVPCQMDPPTSKDSGKRTGKGKDKAKDATKGSHVHKPVLGSAEAVPVDSAEEARRECKTTNNHV